MKRAWTKRIALFLGLFVAGLLFSGCTANQIAMVLSDATVKVANNTDREIRVEIDHSGDQIRFEVNPNDTYSYLVAAYGMSEEFSITIFSENKAVATDVFTVYDKNRRYGPNAHRGMHVFVFEQANAQKNDFVLRRPEPSRYRY